MTRFLLEHDEWVVKIDRPARAARRDGAKTDNLDAVRAAREAFAREHLAAPRARGDREALRVLLTARQGAVVGRTKAIGSSKPCSVEAPQRLRDQLRRGSTDEQLERCARLRTLPGHSIEHRATVRAIRATARRALFLEAEAAEHETEIEQLVMVICPTLLDRPGVGAITAAQFIVSPSHLKRIRSVSAFAALAVPRRSLPAVNKPSATGSTGPQTDSSTEPPRRRPVQAVTQRIYKGPLGSAAQKVNPPARLNGASNRSIARESISRQRSLRSSPAQTPHPSRFGDRSFRCRQDVPKPNHPRPRAPALGAVGPASS
jgi:hypothetical protein